MQQTQQEASEVAVKKILHSLAAARGIEALLSYEAPQSEHAQEAAYHLALSIIESLNAAYASVTDLQSGHPGIYSTKRQQTSAAEANTAQ